MDNTHLRVSGNAKQVLQSEHVHCTIPALCTHHRGTITRPRRLFSRDLSGLLKKSAHQG